MILSFRSPGTMEILCSWFTSWRSAGKRSEYVCGIGCWLSGFLGFQTKGTKALWFPERTSVQRMDRADSFGARTSQPSVSRAAGRLFKKEMAAWILESLFVRINAKESLFFEFRKRMPNQGKDYLESQSEARWQPARTEIVVLVWELAILGNLQGCTLPRDRYVIGFPNKVYEIDSHQYLQVGFLPAWHVWHKGSIYSPHLMTHLRNNVVGFAGKLDSANCLYYVSFARVLHWICRPSRRLQT